MTVIPPQKLCITGLRVHVFLWPEPMNQETYPFGKEAAVVLAGRYVKETDQPALLAGASILNGEYLRSHLYTIYRWKTKDRGKFRLENNSDGLIRDALSLAVGATEPCCAMSVLLALNGVQVSVASAIMTAIRPDTYVIINYSVLEAFGCRTTDHSVGYYIQYLRLCNERAGAWNLSLRDLDRALWQWHKERV